MCPKLESAFYSFYSLRSKFSKIIVCDGESLFLWLFIIWFYKYICTLIVSIKNIFSIILQGRIVSPNCRLEESDDRDGIPGPLYGEEGDGCEEFDRISF